MAYVVSAARDDAAKNLEARHEGLREARALARQWRAEIPRGELAEVKIAGPDGRYVARWTRAAHERIWQRDAR